MTPFSLQRLLNLRADRERDIAAQLARAAEAADRAAARHDAALDVQADGARQLENISRDGASIGTITSLTTAMSSLASRTETAASSRHEAEASAEAIGALMLEATKNRRMIERLRERHVLAVRDADAARDRAMMDAAALDRFIAARAGGTK